jgi:hypothetical protein
MKYQREVIVKCMDNCSCLSVERWDIGSEYVITTYKSYTDRSWKRKLMDIWKILKGESVVDVELILDKDEFQKLVNFK